MLFVFPEDNMNQEKLAKLQAQVRIGGKVKLIFMFLDLFLVANKHLVVFL